MTECVPLAAAVYAGHAFIRLPSVRGLGTVMWLRRAHHDTGCTAATCILSRALLLGYRLYQSRHVAQELQLNPLAIGDGDRSWLPAQNETRGDTDPRDDPRVFFSVALEQFPLAEERLPDGTTERYWREVPGAVNLDLVAAAPDTFTLQRIFRASADLALVAALVRLRQPAAADLYESTALWLLDGPFLSESAIRPNMEWARAQPRQVDLKSTDWRLNHECFLEMNGIVSLLDTVQLLNVSSDQIRRFDSWVREYDGWLDSWRGRKSGRLGVRASLWGRIQNAAMARYLGEWQRYGELCAEGGQILGEMVDESGSVVRPNLNLPLCS